MSEQAAPGNAGPAFPGPGEMSLYAAMLGETGLPLGWLLEGMITAQVTSVLARLGVADELADGPLTAAQLALRVGAAPDALSRLLSAAAVYGLVRKEAAGRFALTPAGDLLRTTADGSARGVAVGFLGPPLWQSAGRLADIVRNPEPVNPAEPGGIYEYFGRHQQEAAWFVQAMGRVTGILVDQFAQAGFRPLASGRIVDVGGSRGTLLAYLLGALPAAHGVLMDRAEALAEAPGFLAEAGVADRVELVVGDFLREVPAGGDLYVLSQILHNWDDEHVRTIAGNCHRASLARRRAHGDRLRAPGRAGAIPGPSDGPDHDDAPGRAGTHPRRARGAAGPGGLHPGPGHPAHRGAALAGAGVRAELTRHRDGVAAAVRAGRRR